MLPSVLNRLILKGLHEYLETGFRASNPYFAGLIDHFLRDDRQFFRGPYVQVGLPFQPGSVGSGFFRGWQVPIAPYRHQEQAWQRLASDRDCLSTLVATGTGSGKTECFLYPILDHCVRTRAEGISAIIVYPMNALATDQARRIAGLIYGHKALAGLRAGLFVGDGQAQDGDVVTEMGREQVITCHETMRNNPPQILLTNYRMLDFLLMRPVNLPLWRGNGGDTLRYLVVDELHTFDGAQGTDLACLIRRLKGRLGIGDDCLICVGTSATLGSDGKQSEVLRAYAETIFGARFDEASVIREERIPSKDFENRQVHDNRYRNLEMLATKTRPESHGSMAAYICQLFNQFLSTDTVALEENDIQTATEQDVVQPKWRCALGKHLQGVVVFKQIMGKLEHGPVAYKDLLTHIKSSFPPNEQRHVPDLLDALWALAAWARDPEGLHDPRLQDRPFVHLRMHLWVRELRRMVCLVRFREDERDTRSHLAFASDVAAESGQLYLPLVQCRDCRHSAWVTVRPKGQQLVSTELSEIYRAFFGRHPDLLLMTPLLAYEEAPQAGKIDWLCVGCGQLQNKDDYCRHCNGRHLQRVFMPKMVASRSVRGGGTRVMSEHRCGGCGEVDTLQIFGARATNLTSLLVSHAFATHYNDDKKVITFSDNVQDAAHRAGYFGARTWRTSLRTALAQAICANGSMGLDKLEDGLRHFWLEEKEMTPEEAVASFLPPGLAWLQDYQDMVVTGEMPVPEDHQRSLLDMVFERMAYEGAEELGLRSSRGRSLGRTGCAAMGPQPGLLASAAQRLLAFLEEHLGIRHLNQMRCMHYLAGICLRLQHQGGICLKPLRGYLERDQNPFMFQKTWFWLPKYMDWRRGPRFLASTAKQVPHECLEPKGGQKWQYRWLEMLLLGNEALANFQGAEQEVWEKALATLCEVGLLEEVRGLKGRLWGLRSENLLVSSRVSALETGRHRLWVPQELAEQLTGMPSLDLNDKGAYREQTLKSHWLANLYRSGQIQRVFPHEYTGMLPREMRKQVETDFSERPHPWSANLLSSTPSLEMGVDIGDLSSVVMCSVPPRGDNYQQRAGRAGRKDGNSLVLTVANGRPHDLFFFEQPLEMIAGNVQPPGIFLNAVSVIERQFVAFCFDRMVSSGILVEQEQKGAKENLLPVRLKSVLKQIQARKDRAEVLDSEGNDVFPYHVLTYVSNHRDSLLQGFFDLFGETLAAETKQALKAHVLPDAQGRWLMKDRLLKRLADITHEQDVRQKQIRKLGRAIKKLKAQPQDKVTEIQLKELNEERFGLRKVRRDLGNKMTLNFLTDEGLLPNYAFPEPGVKLRSVIVMAKRQSKHEESRQVISYQYERPASSAISELAPDNHFYAGGRRVRITRVDLKLSPEETWRLCAHCNHSAPVGDDPGSACPRCGDLRFGDVGQRKKMIKLRSVMARTTDRESQVLDDKDERELKFYTRQMLVSFEQNTGSSAWQLERDGLLFGFEYLPKATFREINFGEAAYDAPEGVVAGLTKPRPGFRVCGECHQVLSRRGDEKHAPFCKWKGQGRSGKVQDCVYLYRELTSEAVRLMVPTGRLEQERLLATFVAVLQLGLRRCFGGQVQHLRMTHYNEPIGTTDQSREFLMLYDTVPGGTGYLKHLIRSRDAFGEILQQAYQCLKDCACAEEHQRDGCYRCLYAYRGSYDHSLVSRELAMAELEPLLAHWQELEAVPSLSVREYEPEVRSLLDWLPAALNRCAANERIGGRHMQVRLVQHHLPQCEAGFILEVEDHTYYMGQQPEVDPRTGAELPFMPDYLIWSAQEDQTFVPIAVFVNDFHQEGITDVFDEDVRTRMAVLWGRKYRLWSLNREDMDLPETWRNLFGEGLDPRVNDVREKMQHAFGLGPYTHICLESPLHQLLGFLARPKPQDWQKLAFLGLLNWLHADFQKKGRALLFEQRVQPLVPKAFWAVWQEMSAKECIYGGIQKLSAWPKVAFGVTVDGLEYADPTQTLVVLWSDTLSETWESDWHAFWRATNILQFLPHFAALSVQAAKRGDYRDMFFVGEQPKPAVEESVPDAWREVFAPDMVEAAHQPILRKLALAGWDPPELGYELTGKRGEVLAHGEIAWAREKLVLLLPEDAGDGQSLWQALGWHVVVMDTQGDWGPAVDAALRTEKTRG